MNISIAGKVYVVTTEDEINRLIAWLAKNRATRGAAADRPISQNPSNQGER